MKNKKVGFRSFKLKNDFPISQEVAEAQIHEFLSYYEISADTITNEEMIKACEIHYDKMVIVIRKGILTIENGEKGELVITHKLSSGTEITYSELLGIHKVQDQKLSTNETSNVAMITERTYSVIANMANLGLSDIVKFKGSDLVVVECLGFFLLNV